MSTRMDLWGLSQQRRSQDVPMYWMYIQDVLEEGCVGSPGGCPSGQVGGLFPFCVHLNSRLQEAEPCECDKLPGLMVAWPPCVHTRLRMWAASVWGSEGCADAHSLYLMEVLITCWLHFPRTLSEPRQAEIRKQCLRLWEVSISPLAHCCSRAGRL